MRKSVKKALSVILTVLLIASIGAMDVFAAPTEYTEIPTVYVIGQGTAIYNAEGEIIAPVEEPEGYLDEAKDACIMPFIRALISGDEVDIEEYQDLLYSWMAPLYDDARMDNNGDPAEGDYVPNQMTDSYSDKRTGAGYNMRAYNFVYDWRMDPVANAAILNQFIENVKTATGFTRINLVGRCEGSTVVMAYLAEYGHGSVQRLFLMMPAYNGMLVCSQLFSNHVMLDSYTASKYMERPEGSGFDLPESELLEFLTSVVDMSAAFYGVDVVNSVVLPMYEKVLEGVLPRLLRASYASMPAMWAMVADRNFDEALEFVFDGCEDEYAGLIERIVYYRENVKYKTEEILQSCLDDGVQIGNITKYGYPSAPLFEESRMLSDGGSTVYDVSFGATTADIGETLSEDYINSRTGAGFGKYISPDKMIDASTGFLRDTTWYFGNLPHPDTPDWVDSFMGMFFNEDGVTVDMHAEYPQFMVYEGPNDNYNAGKMVPLTAENASTSQSFDPEPDFASGFSAFSVKVSAFLARIIAFVKGVIEGIIGHAKGIV